jgi:hypothetical protein
MRLGVGLIALGLAVVAEVLLAMAISAQSIGAYIAGRDPVSGGVYLAVLVIFALMPLMTSSARNVDQRPQSQPTTNT